MKCVSNIQVLGITSNGCADISIWHHAYFQNIVMVYILQLPIYQDHNYTTLYVFNDLMAANRLLCRHTCHTSLILTRRVPVCHSLLVFMIVALVISQHDFNSLPPLLFLMLDTGKGMYPTPVLASLTSRKCTYWIPWQCTMQPLPKPLIVSPQIGLRSYVQTHGLIQLLHYHVFTHDNN